MHNWENGSEVEQQRAVVACDPDFKGLAELVVAIKGALAVGPAGPKGDKGDIGETGPMGPAGAAGKDGVDGKDGINGTNGTDGAVGPVGPQGEVGPAGPQGIQGEKGDKGETGAAGATFDPSALIAADAAFEVRIAALEAKQVELEARLDALASGG